MRVILLIFLTIFITSCDPPYTDTSYMPTNGALASEVRNQTFVQLKNEYGLIPFGVGDGIGDKIRMLALCFRYNKEINIDEARELLMKAGTLFLKNINSNERIRPHLKNDPFRPENIEIIIYLQKPDGSSPNIGNLTIISMIDGVLAYKADLPDSYQLKTVYKETFEEAVTKLSHQTASPSCTF